MRRSTLIPVVGIVIALVVLWFIFFAAEPDEVVVEDADGDAVVVDQEAGAPAATEDTAGD